MKNVLYNMQCIAFFCCTQEMILSYRISEVFFLFGVEGGYISYLL